MIHQQYNVCVLKYIYYVKDFEKHCKLRHLIKQSIFLNNCYVLTRLGLTRTEIAGGAQLAG